MNEVGACWCLLVCFAGLSLPVLFWYFVRVGVVPDKRWKRHLTDSFIQVKEKITLFSELEDF